MTACRDYAKTTGRRITLEYVMLDQVNDTIPLARELAALIHKYNFEAMVNLMLREDKEKHAEPSSHICLPHSPFNPWPGAPYGRSSNERILAFGSELNARGLVATVRWSRGLDILAACGTLKSTFSKSSAFPNSE